MGYIVKGQDGACMAYTGDMGGNLLPFVQDSLSPRVLFVDVTFPSRLEHLAKLTGHLTPGLLRLELLEAIKKGSKLPRIVAVHTSVTDREEVVQELATVTDELNLDLTPGYEDMVVVL